MVKIGKKTKFVFEVAVIGFIVGVDLVFGLMIKEAWREVVLAVGWNNFMMFVGGLCQINLVVVAYSLRSLYYLWKA